MEPEANTEVKPEAGRAKIPVQRFVMILILLVLSGCNDTHSAKEFFFEHPEVSFTKNKSKIVFGKYTPVNVFKRFQCKGELFVFDVNGNKTELLMSSSYQAIKGTNYKVKAG